MRTGLMAALLFTSGVLAADSPKLTPLAIERGSGRVGVEVEVVRSEAARRKGLMGRTTLAPDAGMLFVYDAPQPPDAGFWMYRTLLPLDLAFLDRGGRILAIHTMPPCASEARRCPVYRPGAPYWYALELNGGFFLRHGVGVGDRVGVETLGRP